MEKNTSQQDDLSLLRQVITKRQPQLLPLLDNLGAVPLTLEQRESLRHAVADEFTAAGLRDDWEPNCYGLQIEELIDLLGHL